MNEKPKFMCYRSFKLNDFIGFHFYRSFKLNDFVGFHFYHSFVHVSFVRSCFVHLVNNFDSKRRFLSWRFDLRITNGNTKLWFINNNSQIVWISYTSRGSNKIQGGLVRKTNETWTNDERNCSKYVRERCSQNSFLPFVVHEHVRSCSVHVSFVRFYRFRFYRSSSHERTK